MNPKIKKTMETTILKISAIVLLSSLMWAGCKKESIQKSEDKTLNITYQNYLGCKQDLKSTSNEQYIKLEALGTNQLHVQFINVELNCCPGKLNSIAYMTNEKMKIVFQEEKPAQCNCMCYYDLECIIDSLENREYFVEVYAHGEKPKAKFSFYYSEHFNKIINISNN